MGGKIDCYVDVGMYPVCPLLVVVLRADAVSVSWYSYIAFVDLLANREKLASHGVEIECVPSSSALLIYLTASRFHPVFLGGIMNATGRAPATPSAP